MFGLKCRRYRIFCFHYWSCELSELPFCLRFCEHVEVLVLSRIVWKLGWRRLRRDDDIGLRGQVNALRDELLGERLPAVDLAHGDLP